MRVALESLLIVGSKRIGALETAYARAFENIGLSNVERFDLEYPTRLLTRNRVINRVSERFQDEVAGGALYRYLRSSNINYSAVIVFKGMTLNPQWLTRCKGIKPQATWININPDDPFNVASSGSSNLNVIHAIAQYDIYATWGKHLIPRIESAGCHNVVYLAFAYDTRVHFPAEVLDSQLVETVTFVGTWDRQREKVLTEVAECPLRIYGNFWDRIGTRSPLRNRIYPANLYEVDLRRVISSSKASLNILRPQNYGSHNMRTFEIPAMRGLMITTHSGEQDDLFPNGQACLTYTDEQDLRRQIEHVFDGSIETETMKETAFELCRGNSYDDRARYLCDTIAHHRETGRVA